MKEKKINNVILHVGMPKTSTTSIQETLFKNRFSFKYYYPKSWSAYHGFTLKALCTDHTSIDRNVIKINPVITPVTNTARRKRIEECKKRDRMALFNELYGRQVETLLLSAEQLYVCSEEVLFNVKKLIYELCNTDTSQIKIVIYVRNPISFLTSAFQELVRNILYYTSSDLNTFSNKLASQDMGLQKFITVFGKERLNLFKFEEAVKHPYESIDCFYDAVLKFEPHEITQLKIKKSNESMSQIAADICLFINNKVPMFNQDKTDYSDNRKENDLFLITKTVTGEQFKLDKKIRLIHLNKVKAQVLYLKNTFGIEYSMEQMKLDIEIDAEPNHVPTKKNMQEINRIFYKLDVVIQGCVMDYIRGVAEKHEEYDYLMHYVDKFEKKRKRIFNKRLPRVDKLIKKIKDRWLFLPGRIIRIRYRLRKKIFKVVGVF